MRKKWRRIGELSLLTLGVLDQVLQRWFSYVEVGRINIGVSFGLWRDIPLWVVFFAWMIVAVIGFKNGKWGWRIFLVGGTVNLFSRVLGGGVWDYIYLWPLPFWFNLADVGVVLGVMLYILGV